MAELAKTPRPPYFAVIFTSIRPTPAELSRAPDDGYEATANRMVELAQQQPGYLGLESSRGEDGLGTTVSYWRSLEDVARWKNVAEHLAAQRMGREKWYRSYVLRVAKVEDDWDFRRVD